MVVVSEWFYISQVIFPAKFGFDKKSHLKKHSLSFIRLNDTASSKTNYIGLPMPSWYKT